MHAFHVAGPIALMFLAGLQATLEKKESKPMANAALTPELKKRCLETLRAGIKQTAEFWPSIHAAEALMLSGHGDEVNTVFAQRLKTEKDGNRRIGLSREIYRAGDKSTAKTILELLADPVADVRIHAAESLYKIGEVGDRQLLKKALAQTENSSLRMMAAGALGKSGDADAITVLRKSLANQGSRHYAAWILGRIGDQTDVPALRELVKTETKPMERSFAEHALACLGDVAGRKSLVKNLKSPDATIRALAAEHAGISRTTGAAGTLTELLDDAVLDVRLRAAQALLMLSK
jgi:sialidase-1